jgi:hypothetical protein
MDNPNTHGAFISLPGGNAFIDGIPDTCEHKKEDVVYQAASGKMIFWHTYRQWASLVEETRLALIHEYHQQIDDPIVLGTTQCRECKRIFHPPMF